MEAVLPGDPERVGPYTVLGRLGAGGMGVVYLGRSRGGRTVAVKVIRASLAGEPKYAARFRREVAAARTVTGAFTAPVLDADPDGSPPWLATAYLPGLSLRDAVDGHGPLPPDAVRALAAGLAEALAAVHRAEVVHRDLKPANVMLTATGPRVIDFGIARPADATALTRAGSPLGTPGYMSPEQVRGERVGPPGDIFALGSTLAYAATGAAPFGKGPARVRHYRVVTGQADLSGLTEPWLLALVSACLRPVPAERPTAAGVLERLGPSVPPLDGTGWLPGPVAADIDRRTAAPVLPPAPPVPPVPPRPSGTVRRRTFVVAGASLVTIVGSATLVGEPRAGGVPPGTSDDSLTGPPPRPASRWARRIGGDRIGLTAAGDAVLTGGDGTVQALDARTGDVLWKRENAFGAAPAGDRVYLMHGEGRRLSALARRSGHRWWTYELAFEETPSGSTAATGPMVCFGRDRVTALDAAGGRRRWRADVPADFGLHAAGGLVAAVSSDRMAMLEAATGRTRWTYRIDHATDLRFGSGLVVAYDRFGTLHAIDARRGTAVWTRRYVDGWGSRLGGGVLYVEAPDGVVVALRATDGRELWSRTLMEIANDPRAQATAMGLSGGTLHVACKNGVVYGLDAAGGHVRWVHDAHPCRLVPPVSAAGLVLLVTESGDVRALSEPQ